MTGRRKANETPIIGVSSKEMMRKFEFTWKAFGTVEVEANDEADAAKSAAEALYDIRSIDTERLDVDGVDLEPA